jgi:hypothetical protein
MLATRLFNRSVYLRELLPQDLKVEIECLTRKEAVAADIRDIISLHFEAQRRPNVNDVEG